jgi:hypothetical protein
MPLDDQLHLLRPYDSPDDLRKQPAPSDSEGIKGQHDPSYRSKRSTAASSIPMPIPNRGIF